ncbi:unnamed protein product [Arabidopsis thaliana]|uniref:(thale cress) hypothetical protein n=1 Tax=Arabidopsis thaliana TaxID=3702 RepID=A0A7G2FDA7_ARATH|nr:unnamed protein product [Arabidopsis thaliana]
MSPKGGKSTRGRGGKSQSRLRVFTGSNPAKPSGSRTLPMNPPYPTTDLDYEELLDGLLNLPGRQHLPVLSKVLIPGIETLCILLGWIFYLGLGPNAAPSRPSPSDPQDIVELGSGVFSGITLEPSIVYLRCSPGSQCFIAPGWGCVSWSNTRTGTAPSLAPEVLMVSIRPARVLR